MSNPGIPWTLGDEQRAREDRAARDAVLRPGSATRALAEPASAGLSRPTRSRMEMVREIAPDLHDAVLCILAAEADGDPVRRQLARQALACAVQLASGGRGWAALHGEMNERRSLSESIRQGVG